MSKEVGSSTQAQDAGYNPDQLRDKNGRWTKEASSGTASSIKETTTPPQKSSTPAPNDKETAQE